MITVIAWRLIGKLKWFIFIVSEIKIIFLRLIMIAAWIDVAIQAIGVELEEKILLYCFN